MIARALGTLALVVALSLSPPANAAPPEPATSEITYLLAYIGNSGCEFYRNGDWYDPKQAQAHLRDKYDFLVARDRIGTAEDFIDKAATASSLTGRPYQVRCDGGEPVPAGQWLHDLLARYRLAVLREAGAPQAAQ